MSIGESRGIGDMDLFDLVIRELRYQNPLEPMSTGEFLSQLTQIANLTEIHSMRSDVNALKEAVNEASKRAEEMEENQKALSMLGAWVEYHVAGAGAGDGDGALTGDDDTAYGMVTSVVLEDVPVLFVSSDGGISPSVAVEISDVVRVLSADPRQSRAEGR